MAQFPRYNSQANLTTQQPKPFINEAADKTKIIGNVIDTLSDTVVKLNNAIVTSQLNSFKASKGIFLADIKSRASLDPDQNASEKYFKELDDYSKTALKGMSERAKAEAGFELQTDLAIAKTYIGGVFHHKILKEANKNLAVSLKSYGDAAVASITPKEMQKNIAEAYTTIEKNVQGRIISADAGKRLTEKFNEDIRVGEINRDLYSNPDQFKKNAANGGYSFKDAQEKSRKLAAADHLIEKDKAQFEEAKKVMFENNENNLTQTLLIGGVVTEEDIDKAELLGQVGAEGGISKGFAASARRYINGTNPKQTDNVTFNKIALDMLNPIKLAKDIRPEILNQNAIGKLTDADADTLNTFLEMSTKENVEKFLPKRTWLNRIFHSGEDAGLKQEIIANMFKSYIQRVNQGESPETAASEVISVNLDSHLAEQLKKPNRQYAVNPDNKRRIYSDDGGVTWLDEKTNEVIK